MHLESASIVVRIVTFRLEFRELYFIVFIVWMHYYVQYEPFHYVVPNPIPAATEGQYNYEIEWKVSNQHLSVGESTISPEQTIPSSDISIDFADQVL